MTPNERTFTQQQHYLIICSARDPIFTFKSTFKRVFTVVGPFLPVYSLIHPVHRVVCISLYINYAEKNQRNFLLGFHINIVATKHFHERIKSTVYFEKHRKSFDTTVQKVLICFKDLYLIEAYEIDKSSK